MNKLINVEEATKMLEGIGRSTLYRLVNNKKLEAKKLGGRTVFTNDAIESYVESLENYEGGRNVF